MEGQPDRDDLPARRVRHPIQPRIGDPRIVLIRDKDLASDLDLIVDWEVGEHLLLTAAAGALLPNKGIEQTTRGSATWTHGMLYVSIPF